MKTHHLANVILVIVLLTAFLGMYFMFKGPGKAVQMQTVEVDTQGKCCCMDKGVQFVKSSITKTSSQLLQSDCVAMCQESSATIC